MKPSQSPTAASAAARASVAERFRGQIERAAAEGVCMDDLALHLTLGDVEQLKRDRAVPVADISFIGGVMRYLGVPVVKGGVAASVLRRPEADGS